MKLEPGTHLRYSLTRNASRGAQIGCTFAIALLLGGIGVPILFLAGKGDGVVYVVGGGFSLVALLLLYSAIHQLFALRTPQTIIEVDRQVFARGEEVIFFIRQPGPASFESLRGNLVGEESWWEGSGKTRRHVVKQLGVFNLFDTGSFEAPFERELVAEIPRELVVQSEHSIHWQLEVWGKVNGRADFQHVFSVEVV